MTQYFGKNIDDHPWPEHSLTWNELKRRYPDDYKNALALRAAEGAERVKQRLSVSPELLSRER